MVKLSKDEQEWVDMMQAIYDSDSREEQEAILQKMYHGVLTREELDSFFPTEAEMELFDRWSDTTDREEFICLTMQLFPGTSREEAEKRADKLKVIPIEKGMRGTQNGRNQREN